MLQVMVDEKQNLQHQIGSMAQELQSQASAKDGLQAKIQQLYATLLDRMDDKEGVDRLFG